MLEKTITRPSRFNRDILSILKATKLLRITGDYPGRYTAVETKVS